MPDRELRPPVRTMDDLIREVSKVLLLADTEVVRLICYTVVANILRFGPVWTCLIAPPSGGKSELLQSLNDLKDTIFPLSSLTPQTFLSGMQSNERQTSLLDIVNGKIIVTKDFTTIVEMNKEEQRSIFGQMREIYDKRFTKAFGTGVNKDWAGHVGWLGAVTSEGAEKMQSRGAMGERFIYYRMKQPDRRAVQRKASENQEVGMEQQQLHLRTVFYEYLAPRVKAAREVVEADRKVKLGEEIKNRIEELTNFATEARSNVNTHWKTGHILFVHPKEMPVRFTNQCIGLAAAALFCHRFDYPEDDPRRDAVTLDKHDMIMFGNIAWGSVPPHRAAVIKLLAEYGKSSTKAIAAKLGYDTDVARPWLAELAGLEIVKRDASTSGADYWEMRDDLRDLVNSYTGKTKRAEGISESELGIDDSEEYDTDTIVREYNHGLSKEEVQRMEEKADRLFNGLEVDPDNY